MAGGWTRDGAVQEQIDASLADAVKRARRNIGAGGSAELCEQCGLAIPAARREAVPGVQHCVICQSMREDDAVAGGGINRRGSKDSQLR
ncbi:MAG: DksA/TraR family C4-type zinc finger protein [Proteobacteria bacterium]|nr:DksA/TraR family C4-type zinc finger protein [Pseudomonadota bacterium]